MRIAFLLVFILTSATASNSQTPTPTPELIREDVVVVADRVKIRVGDSPASVSVITNTDLSTSAAPTIDDALRQSVGFSTFRRSGSRISNPTTQGVSFRGIGSSGASRAVILFDGVPLNDAFGGWVQWQRVSAIAVDQVEVLRGGASSLYGDYSLSGAINIIPRNSSNGKAFSAEAFAGMQNTISASFFAGRTVREFDLDGTAAIFQTRGYIPIEFTSRGVVDSFSGVRSSNFSMRVGREFGKSVSIYFRPSIFGEVRTNGTGLQTNRTHIRQLIVGGDISAGPLVSWRIYGGTQVYDQTFSAVNSLRTMENLLRIQRVPSGNQGGSVILSGTTGEHSLVAGFEIRRVNGASVETIFSNGVANRMIGGGGRETAVGGFVRDFLKIRDRLVVVTGLRFDRWTNERGLVASRDLSNSGTTVNTFFDRSEIAVSPQAALLYRLNKQFSIYASGSTSFRTPTLNELYRAFRVGSVNTLANADLRAERAVNVESGINVRIGKAAVRSSVFLTTVNHAVSNVTLTSTPSLITRQRQNAGQIRSAGFEIDAETRFRQISLSFGYLFANSMVVRFPSEPGIVGLRIPQVARHQFTAQGTYANGKWSASVQARAAGQQFDDDQNLFSLEPYFQLDLLASRKLGESISIFVAIENITNSRYSTARTPLRSVSSPINIRAGFRWN